MTAPMADHEEMMERMEAGLREIANRDGWNGECERFTSEHGCATLPEPRKEWCAVCLAKDTLRRVGLRDA